ncbi:MAG: V-type ATPase subunit [Clostridiales bacterium]|nr:V-type ATPase subunit [Clostridiales bacterium]
MNQSAKAERYLYATARIRALENSMIGRDGSSRLCDARSAAEAAREIAERAGVPDADAALESMLSRAFGEVTEMTASSDDGRAFDVMRYPYDCHNIKYAMKCFARGRSAREAISGMYGFASVDPVKVYEAASGGDASCLPANMAEAAETAASEFAKNRDPKSIDIALDAACYADMLAKADESGIDIFKKAVRLKIDLTNIVTALRVLRLGGGRLMKAAMIKGGGLDTEKLSSLDGEGALWSLLRTSGFLPVAEAAVADDGFESIEKACDMRYLGLFSGTRYIAYGPEIPASYLTNVEYEVKNLRIILAGKTEGADPRVLRSRLREWWK